MALTYTFDVGPPSRGSSGLTLFELVIALTLLSVLTAIAVSGVLEVGASGELTERGSRHTQSRLQLSTLLRRTLARAKARGLNPEGDAFEFSVPVCDPVTGSHVDAAGAPVWGISDSGGDRVGGSCTISFVTLRVREEADEEIDINGDGDLEDTFDEGVLRRTTDSGEELPMASPLLLQVAGNHGADVDGDDVPDPIFSLKSTRELTLTMVFSPAAGKLRVHRFAILIADV